MPRLTIDASVAVKWLVTERDEEEFVPQALAILLRIQKREIQLLQPIHWLAEVAAVASRLFPQRAAKDLAALYAMAFPVDDRLDVYQAACQLAVQSQQHLFDTLYHAVALRNPNTTLVTADRRYYNKAKGHGNIAWIGEYAIPKE